MSRHVMHLPAVYPERWTDYYRIGGTGELSGYDDDGRAAFTEIRNVLRAELETITGMKVSDIGIWTGSGVYEGMIFEIHNSLTDCSWYVVSGHRPSDSPTVPDIDDYLGASGANLRTLVKAIGSALASASNSPSSGFTFTYNPDTTISRADLDHDDANLRYTGGDFTSLSTINPDTLAGLQAIVPSHCPYGMTTDVMHASSYPAWCMAYDSDEDAILLCLQSANGYQLSFTMFGKILNPTSAGDTNEAGMSHIYGSIDATYERGVSHTEAECSAFDIGGTRRDYDISPTFTIGHGNYKVVGGTDDGKLNWRAVACDNGTGGSGAKGYFKESLMVEIGPRSAGFFFKRPIQFPDAAHPVVVYTDVLALFWKDGARTFPSYYVWNP